MKNYSTFILLLLSFTINAQVNKVNSAQGKVSGPTEANAVGFNVGAYGPTSVCPGSVNNKYYTNKNFSGNQFSFEKIVFSCGGGGIITESGETTYTILYDIFGYLTSQPECHINWNNANGVSWVTATYHYTLWGVKSQKTSQVLYVNIGVTSGANSNFSVPNGLCMNSSGTFNASTSQSLPAGATGYYWSATNATISVGAYSPTATVSYSSANNNPITVTLRYYSSTCNVYSNGFTKTIVRNNPTPLEEPGLIYYARAGSLCSYNPYISPVPGADSYEWSLNNFSTIEQTTTDPKFSSFEAFPSTIYTIYVRAKNSSCNNISPVRQSTGSTPGLPPGCQWGPTRIANSINTSDSEKQISIFPNPANTFFEVNLPEGKSNVFIKLINMEGKIMKNISTFDSKLTIETSDLPKGLYFINISSDEINQTRKISIIK